jgi:hypothetical protein
MKKLKGYESYPGWIVLLSNLITISVLAAGFYLLYLINFWLALVFLVYALYMEASVYREGCVNCYYYGKRCGFGRGLIAKILLKKGNPKKFTEKSVSMKDFLPSMLVSIIPIIAGIYLLITGFSWFILILTVWPVFVWFVVNPKLFGELICPNCKQCSICCPVAEFFKKQAMKKKRKK